VARLYDQMNSRRLVAPPIGIFYDGFLMSRYYRRRRRRGAYSMASDRRAGRGFQRLVGVVLLAIILYVGGSWVLDRFGAGNTIQRTGTTLLTEGRGTIHVSLDGKTAVPAEDGLKLFAGDRITGRANGEARLEFFDGTWVRLNEQTDLTITKSNRGAKTSRLELSLHEGSLWTATPSVQSFSGTILRRIETDHFALEIPSQSEAVITSSSLIVFAADGAVSVLLCMVPRNQSPSEKGSSLHCHSEQTSPEISTATAAHWIPAFYHRHS